MSRKKSFAFIPIFLAFYCPFLAHVEATGNKRVIHEFGNVVLEWKERTLLADGVSVHLQSKEFDTLLLLVERDGHVRTKEEMIAVIWPDSVVEEGNLAKRSGHRNASQAWLSIQGGASSDAGG